MADFLRNAFGGAKKADAPAAANPDSDFADFADAPSAVPEPAPAAAGEAVSSPSVTAVPYTKWYNVHERHSLSEFKAEGIILSIAAVVFLFHFLGARINRNKARKWIRGNASVIKSEFALVGFNGVPTMDNDVKPDTLLKEKSLFEYSTYATGRLNTAFVDFDLTLVKRFNPMVSIFETLAGFFIESMPAPYDALQATAYPFDGRENQTVPSLPGSAEARAKDPKSTYDAFVWAVVNKERMQRVRDERYDLSLTFTKDHPKLPDWLSVMSENAEITDALLTPELVDAIKAAGDLFEYIIISDQPIEKPTTLEEAVVRKRIFLKYRLPSNNSYENLEPIMAYFLALPDALVKVGRFRPEVQKKVRNTREGMLSEIKKVLDEEKAEERAIEREKVRKAKRDADLKGLDAKAQKKYLEKEKDKELRKSQKRQTMRG